MYSDELRNRVSGRIWSLAEKKDPPNRSSSSPGMPCSPYKNERAFAMLHVIVEC